MDFCWLRNILNLNANGITNPLTVKMFLKIYSKTKHKHTQIIQINQIMLRLKKLQMADINPLV